MAAKVTVTEVDDFPRDHVLFLPALPHPMTRDEAVAWWTKRAALVKGLTFGEDEEGQSMR